MTIGVIDHFNTTLAGMSQNEDKVQFMLRTAHIVNAFITEQDNTSGRTNDFVPRPFYKNKWRNTMQVKQNRTLDTIKNKYFNAVGITLVRDTAPPSDRDAIEQPSCCASPNVMMLIEHAVCASCGRKVKDSTQYGAAIGDGQTNINCLVTVADQDDDVTIVDKTSLVNRSLLRLQGFRISAFKEAEWKRLYNNVTNGIADVDVTSMSCSMINRKLGAPDKKFAKDIYVIWEKVTGQQLTRVPDAVLWLIHHKIANQIVIPTTRGMNQKQPRILAMTLLYKCFQLCGEKQLANLIVMQHADTNIASFAPIWRLTCEKHNLKYMV